MKFNNSDVSLLLKQVAAALVIKKQNQFQIRAYENAATSIEHLTSEVQDLWEEGKLDDVPGIGEGLKTHLDELFRTGKVKHWDDLKKGLPSHTFSLLGISGIGPKTALQLADLGVKSLDDLKIKIENGLLVEKGFSEKVAKKLSLSLQEKIKVSTGRMLLSQALQYADIVLKYIESSKAVEHVDSLGSLRRRVSTIGDLDFSVCCKDFKAAIDHVSKMPGTRILNQGDKKLTLKWNLGPQLDFLFSESKNYGNLLQHFTGSKQHNIHLRTIAEEKGYSLSENGVKKLSNNQFFRFKTESELYKLLGMQTPPPEIREDTGEIELSLLDKLPKLIEEGDIKGEFHIHSNFLSQTSHDSGSSSMEEMIKMARNLNYQYLAFSEHNPKADLSTHEKIDMIKEKKEQISRLSSEKLHVLNSLEIDIGVNGDLALPSEAFEYLDICIASIHSGFRGDKESQTKRVLQALANPKVKIFGHPTARKLLFRGEVELDWVEIFKICLKNKIALEINSADDRLDLPDMIVKDAVKAGVKLVINTDAHSAEGMKNLELGISVARRGWATKKDIINTWSWKEFKDWFGIK